MNGSDIGGELARLLAFAGTIVVASMLALFAVGWWLGDRYDLPSVSVSWEDGQEVAK